MSDFSEWVPTMRMSRAVRYLKNLRQEIPQRMRREYMTQQAACDALKKWTGQDFGFDADAWETWLRTDPTMSIQFDSIDYD